MIKTALPDADLRALFAGLAAAHAEDDFRALTLPVTPVGDPADDSYRPEEERVRTFVQDHLAASVPEGRSSAARDLQILNGNGRPGIGQEVAELLLPAGFRGVLTDNADRFDYPTTRIVVFSDDADHLAAAEEIRVLLGVGAVERSLVPQSVVDIQIVVGLDFLDRVGPPPSSVPSTSATPSEPTAAPST